MAVFARSGEGSARVTRLLSWKLIAPIVAVLVTLVLAAFAAQAVYASRALPGVSVGGVAIGSLEAAAIRARLTTELAAPWAAARVTVSDGTHTWLTTNGELGIAPDLDGAVAAAIAYGKQGQLTARVGACIDALRGDARVPFAMTAQGDRLDRWVANVAREVDRAPVSGELRITYTGIEGVAPQLGRTVDRGATVAALLAADTLGPRDVALRVRTAYPEVDASGFDEAYARAVTATTPLTVRVEDRSWSEVAAGLATLLQIDRVAVKPGELPAIPGDAIAPTARYRYTVSLSDERVTAWVAALATVLDHPGRSARFVVSREGALSIKPSESGVRVDQDKLRALFLDELFKPANGAARQIAAPAAVDASILTTEQAKELLPKLSRTSTYTTYYPPSASRPSRIHRIDHGPRGASGNRHVFDAPHGVA